MAYPPKIRGIRGTYSKSAIDFKEKAADPSSPVMAVSRVRESIVAKTVKKTMALPLLNETYETSKMCDIK